MKDNFFPVSVSIKYFCNVYCVAWYIELMAAVHWRESCDEAPDVSVRRHGNSHVASNWNLCSPTPPFPLPAEHRRRPSWPRATAAARDPSGRGWPDCATSIRKPTNRQRMFPECDLCSSLSNRPLWCVRGKSGALSSRNFLPFWILTSRCFWRAQTPLLPLINSALFITFETLLPFILPSSHPFFLPFLTLIILIELIALCVMGGMNTLIVHAIWSP